MEIVVKNIDQLEEVVEKLLQFAGKQKIIVFNGEIGAGKTTFIKRFCKHLGVQEEVTSPTFSLINEYPYTDKNGQEALIFHADLYRLKSLEEAIDIGIEDYLYSGNYCLIEWPDLINPLLPLDVVRVEIEITEDSKRKIVLLRASN